MSLVWSPERKYEHENDLSLVAPGVGIVKAVGKDRNGATLYTLELTRFTPGSAVSVQSEVPWTKQYELLQNYPNPFNPRTTISYRILSSGHVGLKVFDALGRDIVTLLDQEIPAGTHSACWDAQEYPSGVYIYRINVGAYVESKKMLLTK